MFTAGADTLRQLPSDPFNTLCDAVFRAVQTELEQHPADLLAIVDHYRSATEVDWHALTDPASRSPLRLMLSDPNPEVADDIWPLHPSPGRANCGTLVLGSTAQANVKKLAAAYPIADSEARLSALSGNEGFLLTNAYGEPTGVLFKPHYQSRSESANPP